MREVDMVLGLMVLGTIAGYSIVLALWVLGVPPLTAFAAGFCAGAVVMLGLAACKYRACMRMLQSADLRRSGGPPAERAGQGLSDLL